MGCDIHIFLERQNGTNKWVDCTPYKRDGFDDTLRPQDRYSRNYLLFSILAGVRDYSGAVEPIAPPRGVPDDCSNGYREFVELWEPDGHNHSYFTITELLNDMKKRSNTLQKETLNGFIVFLLRMIDAMNPCDFSIDYNEYRVCFFFDN